MSRPSRRQIRFRPLAESQWVDGVDNGSDGIDWTTGQYDAPVLELDELTDVTITDPVAGDRLRFDGSGWVNSPLFWRNVMTYDGTNWLPVVDGDGNAIYTEA